MPYLLHYGTDAQKAKYMPRATAGEMIFSIAMTEPGAGSDLQGIKTNAKKVDGGWLLNGSKTYITNGGMSDLCFVVAKTNPGKKAAHGTSIFLVEAGTPGYSKGSMLKKMGLKAQDTCELFFEDVLLPDDALLGEQDKGFYYLMNELPQAPLL